MATAERPSKRTKIGIELVPPKVGDRVYAKYSNGEWYWGTATKRFYKNNDLYYSIQYDDGEFVKEHNALNGIATEEQAQLKDSKRKKQKKNKKVKSEEVNIEFVQPEKGDRVYAKYSNGEWYWGWVEDKFYKKDGNLYYSIQYDDGEFVSEHNAADGIATEEQYHWQESERDRLDDTSRATVLSTPAQRPPRSSPSRAATAVTPVEIQSDTTAPDGAPSRCTLSTASTRNVTPEITPSGGDVVTPDPAPEREPSSMGAGIPSTLNETTVNASSTVDAPLDTNGPTPDPAPSSRVAEVRREVLANMATDSRIKAEGSASTLSVEEKEKRDRCLAKWIKANTDPRTGKGRYVFKRGCAKGCLTTVLGGVGTIPWPASIHPPKYNGQPNPFIAENEFYVAGNEDWNFFTPRFPGDTGLVNSAAFTENLQSKQKEFHMFVQCATQKHKRHWHGHDAMTGRMYVGVYRKVVDEDGDDDVATIVKINDPDLDVTNRHGIAKHRLRYFKKRFKQNYAVHRDFVIGKFLAKEEAGDDWPTSTAKQDVLAMYQMLILGGFEMKTVPIEFVRYDEDLYQALVDVGATIDRNGQTGRVALTAEGLNQYY